MKSETPVKRVIHAHGPGQLHPFKGATLCGKLVRFGGLETEGRPVTCKTCLMVLPLAREFDGLRDRVQALMGWDIYQADRWMKTENPLLGNAAPIEFIRRGRGHKVAAFIASAEDENKPLE
jgi:hypothetical protein